jgi:PAS domain S-box-containing protein
MKNNKKILLVEDEALVAMFQKQQLEKKGYTVNHVSNGEDAIKSASETSYDLILMDIDLGTGIDGTEAAAEILREKDIPVVFLSSHTEPEVVEKTEKITSYGYVVKNSGVVILEASIKMAFKLFDAKIREKEKELALQENEIKQKTMLANISDVIVIIDKDGINRYKSPNITKWFGWQPEELIGKSTWDNVHPDDLEDSQLFLTGIMEKPGASGTTELRYLCKNGEYAVIEITLVNLLHDRVIQGVLGNYHDISIRKQIEQEQFALAALVENSNDLALVKNTDRCIISVNNNFLRASVVNNLSDLVGKRDADILDIPENKNINIEKKIGDFSLSSKKVIPIGIIINELMTNIFKYAFNGRKDNHVLIELDKTDTHIILVIKDNGVGIDERVNLNQSPGFGLTIVNMLAEQLNGTYTIENDNGTRSIVKLEL